MPIVRSLMARCAMLFSVSALALSGCLLPRVAHAEEQILEFVHALQTAGYGDVASDYLNQLAARTDLAPEIREVLDLEMAASLRTSAANTVNADEEAFFTAEAQRFLDKFLQEQPNHPQAASAYATSGDLAYMRAQKLMRSATNARVAEQKTKLFAEAREALLVARPKYVQSAELFDARFNALMAQPDPEQGKSTAKGRRRPGSRVVKVQSQLEADREQAEDFLLESRFKLAQVDHSLARTYQDEKDPARLQALKDAAAGFDGIYHKYNYRRDGGNRAALLAHMWHGKVMEEMGDLVTALDIYDEVLANAPDAETRQRPDELFEALFAEVEYFRLQILGKTGEQERLLNEAEEWLQINRAARKTAGYQGIKLELVKAEVAKAEKLTGAAQNKAFQSIMADLAEIAKVPSEHQQDAILLRRLYSGKAGEADIKTFDEAFAVANDAASSGFWDQAISGYSKAIAMKDGAKDADKVVTARYQLAYSNLMAEKLPEAFQVGESLARELPNSKMGPQASALAISAALGLYADAEDKTEAEKRLLAITDYTIKTWPERAEADDARLALGRLNLVRGESAEAIKVFENVNNKSDRYPTALQLAAQTYWRLYLEEKRKPEGEADTAAMQAHHAKVVEQLNKSLSLQQTGLAGNAPLPKPLMETMLLLAEVHLESGKPDQAAGLLAPLTEQLKSAQLESLDTFTLRVFVSGTRAYVAMKDLGKASEVAMFLVDAGQDAPQVNGVLVEFVRMLRNELKRAEGDATLAAGGTDQAVAAASAATVAANKELLAKLLEKLAARQQMSLAGMVFIAETCAEVGMRDKAREQFESILTRVEQDQSLLQGNPRAPTRVRSQLIGLLREEGQYDEALKQVELLLKDNKNQLEPMLEKGRILQSWAESSPTAKRYEDAVAYWTQVRNLLQRIRRKPPEYYEVVYNAAFCLVGQAEQSKNTKPANQAEQLLKSALILSPKLSGPDLVAKYRVLLDKAIKLQGRK